MRKENDMNKQVIATDKAPAAIGPYSQAIRVGDMVFSSGVIPVIPATGEIVEGIENQTKQVLSNIKALLESQELSMSDIIKTTVFIKNMDDFGKINEIYATFFEGDYPARSCVEVARLPKDVLIEVEVIAAVK